MIILSIDPGAAGAGYCAWDAGGNRPIYIGATCPTEIAVNAIVVESGFVGKMGCKAMWGLGFDAGWRLHEAWLANFIIGPEMFTIRPDGQNGWRAALPPRPDLPAAQRFTQFDGLPGDVIVNRLRIRYGLHAQAVEPRTEHEVEAVGIAEAAAAILQRPKASQRKALVRVKR